MFRIILSPDRWLYCLVLVLLQGYQQYISPLFPNRCRFYPSCSQYSVLAIKQLGLTHGLILTVRRLLQCHPWHVGGVDFPPKT